MSAEQSDYAHSTCVEVGSECGKLQDDLAASSTQPSANSSFNFDHSVLCVGAGLDQSTATNTDGSTEHDRRRTTVGRHVEHDHGHDGLEEQQSQFRHVEPTSSAGEENTSETGTHAQVAGGAKLTEAAASKNVAHKTGGRQE